VPDVANVGRFLLITGAVLLVIGAVLLLSERVPFLAWLGRLPGDLVFRRGNTTIFVPIVTSIVLSVILTLVLSLLFRRQ
jgi:hypothetical protein